ATRAHLAVPAPLARESTGGGEPDSARPPPSPRTALEQEDQMKRLLALLCAVAVGSALASTALAGPADVHSGVAKKPVTTGFYRGKMIGYFDFGPIKLRHGNKLAPIWTVTNGAAGQHNIVDSVPGQAAYSPLWQLNTVTFKQGVTPYLLRSKADVDAAATKGDISVNQTRTVVN